MSNYTRGPWAYRKAKLPTDGKYDFGISADFSGKPFCIAEAFGRVGREIFPDAEANARLITAAPDMLAALQRVDRLIDKHLEKWAYGETHQIIRAAIAKATETPKP